VISKSVLKKELKALGIKTYRHKTTGAVFVRKGDVKKILAANEKFKVVEISTAKGDGEVLILDSGSDQIEVRNFETTPLFSEGDSISGDIEFDEDGLGTIENIVVH